MVTTGRNRRRYSGKILYIGDTTGERGREWFNITVEPDGTRTLRSQVEIDAAEINKTRVLREVTYTLDAKWRPLDAFVRITVDDVFGGSSWFRFGEKEVECEGFTAGEGRISQKFPVSARPKSFGPHPVVCDIWHLGGGWDWTNPATRQGWTAIMSSPLPNGASGPMIGHQKLEVDYHGEETITVKAGTFDCKHFSFVNSHRPGAAAEHMCYTGDTDIQFVKIRWDYSKTTYELVEIYDWADGRKGG